MGTAEFEALQRRHGVAGVVSFDESPLGGPVARLASGGSSAEIALQGAQVLGWTPAGHAPALWLSPVERLGTGKPIRGGIPVCWPWFANHPDDPAKPTHGFVRTRQWSVTSAGMRDGAATLELRTATTLADAALWAHSAEAELEVALGERLTLSLTTRNTGPGAIRLTQALHTYFAVGDIAQVRVDGFDGLGYIDKLAANARKSWSGPILFAGEVDRIYLGHSGAAEIVDAAAARTIRIEKSGSASTVVWNPWIEKCARLGDMGPEGYRRMVCIETANAGDDVVSLAPGAAHTITAVYSVRHGS